MHFKSPRSSPLVIRLLEIHPHCKYVGLEYKMSHVSMLPAAEPLAPLYLVLSMTACILGTSAVLELAIGGTLKA